MALVSSHSESTIAVRSLSSLKCSMRKVARCQQVPGPKNARFATLGSYAQPVALPENALHSGVKL
jgi:hypothetical protein